MASEEKAAMNRSSLWLVCSLLLATPLARAKEKVTICHFPRGNHAKFRTIKVGPRAARAHILRHGDVPGECCAIEGICDDGNPCTSDRCSDDACTSRPVDCDDGDPCTVEVGCDPEAGCVSEPVLCEAGHACQHDTGACLPVGECPCWPGSNPIDVVTSAAARANPFPCIDLGRPTCDGSVITQSGQASGPNGAMASFSMSLSGPNADSCATPPAPNGGGACSCPPPPEECEVRGIIGITMGVPVDEPNPCIPEFAAACAALQ
jgi:hypothetical protein